MDTKAPGSIDEYIARFPQDIAAILQTIRQEIKNAAPMATEKISYQMPTFYYLGNIVHFAAFRDHIGFFPGAAGVEAFLGELLAYSVSKGTIRFPLDKPVPLDLVRRITIFRVAQNEQWAREKRGKKTK
jgi:uncharacterized protein YdhG (YjbR/CyaY superfamily)